MKTIFKIYITLLTAIALFTSCTKDITEINKNPNGFTTANTGALFNKVVSSLLIPGNEQFYLQNEIFYPQTQLAAITSSAWGNYQIGTADLWNNFYGTLAEIRELENRFEKIENTDDKKQMQAMLKILFAYKAFRVTDVFGDIPLTQAGYGFQNLDFLYPEFNTQEEVYKYLLNELKWAEDNINDTTELGIAFKDFAPYDQIFNGNLSEWRKFGNSLRLRYAIRMYDADPEFAGTIVKELIEENKSMFTGYQISGYVGESASLWPSKIGFSNSVEWSFREHKNLRMGSNIWHLMSENDSTDGSGIFDNRAYFFFEINNDSQWVAYPQIAPSNAPPAGGVPYSSGRDSEGGENLGKKGVTNIYSPFGYFLIRDANTVPLILITGNEVHFLKAEAYLRGIGVASDFSQFYIEYLNGIQASNAWWMNIAHASRTQSHNLKFSDYVDVPDPNSSTGVQLKFDPWNAENDEEVLTFLYTQRMIDLFRQPDQAYALARRTGNTIREGEKINHFRMPYPAFEVENNSENCQEAIRRQGGDSPDVKLWWVKW